LFHIFEIFSLKFYNILSLKLYTIFSNCVLIN